MRRAALLLLLALPGCLVGRSLYYDSPAGTESAVTGDASPSEGGPQAPETEGGSRDPGGETEPGETEHGTGMTSADAAADARPDAAPKDAGPVVPVCAGGGAVEREPNDTSGAAEAMKLGVTCGELASPADNDWFTFDSGDDQGGLVVLNFKADGDARVRIQNGILGFEAQSGEGFNIPSDGRWLTRVYSPSGKPQKYTLTRPAR